MSVKPAPESAYARPKPRAPLLESAPASCPFATPGWLSRRKKLAVQGRNNFSLHNNSRFSPLVLAHEVPALLWLVDGRATSILAEYDAYSLNSTYATLLITRESVPRHARACCGALPDVTRQHHLPLACHLLLPKGAKLQLTKGTSGGYHPQPTEPPPRLNRPAEPRTPKSGFGGRGHDIMGVGKERHSKIGPW